MRNAHCVHSWLVITFLLFSSPAQTLYAAPFTITDLGFRMPLPVINNNSQIAGGRVITGQVLATLWDNGNVTDVRTPSTTMGTNGTSEGWNQSGPVPVRKRWMHASQTRRVLVFYSWWGRREAGTPQTLGSWIQGAGCPAVCSVNSRRGSLIQVGPF